MACNVYLWPGSALLCNERSAACQRPPPSSRHPPLLPPAAKPPVTGPMPPPSAHRSHLALAACINKQARCPRVLPHVPFAAAARSQLSSPVPVPAAASIVSAARCCPHHPCQTIAAPAVVLTLSPPAANSPSHGVRLQPPLIKSSISTGSTGHISKNLQDLPRQTQNSPDPGTESSDVTPKP